MSASRKASLAAYSSIASVLSQRVANTGHFQPHCRWPVGRADAMPGPLISRGRMAAHQVAGPGGDGRAKAERRSQPDVARPERAPRAIGIGEVAHGAAGFPF